MSALERKVSRAVAAKADTADSRMLSPAAVDTFDEELFGNDGEWEEVPVHTVIVRDRRDGSTYEVEVPQVRAHSTHAVGTFFTAIQNTASQTEPHTHTAAVTLW